MGQTGRNQWPVLRVAVPHDFYAMVLQDARAAGRKVSELCRERLMAGWALARPSDLTPSDSTELVRGILSRGGEMDAWAFASTVTKALKLQMAEDDSGETAPQVVWDMIEDWIRRGVLKAEMREGVRIVSLLS